MDKTNRFTCTKCGEVWNNNDAKFNGVDTAEIAAKNLTSYHKGHACPKCGATDIRNEELPR